MTNKPIITTKRFKSFLLIIQYVFRANFNDTYWLEEKVIDLEQLDKDKLTWFDPFNGRSKINNTLLAIKYVSDDSFIILKKQDDVVTEQEIENYLDYIVCEDYDQSMLLAAHIRIKL